jgi:hypothetical protein
MLLAQVNNAQVAMKFVVLLKCHTAQRFDAQRIHQAAGG